MNTVTTFLKRDARITFFTLTVAVTLLLFAGWDQTNAAKIPLLAAAQVDTPAATMIPLQASGAALDVHTHIASQALTDAFTGGGVPAAGAADLVARLDEAQVQRAVILSAAYFGAPAGFQDDANVSPENDNNDGSTWLGQ